MFAAPLKEEVDREQEPCYRVCVANNAKAETGGYGHYFVRPHEIIDYRDDEGESCPCKPREIEAAFDHDVFLNRKVREEDLLRLGFLNG